MSNITEMKSILDRQVKGVEGDNVGVTNPSDGNYYTIEGSSDSPFDVIRGPKMDQLVKLLDTNVASNNQENITHTKGILDLNGVKGPIFGDASGQGKQLGNIDLHEAMLTNPYTNNGVTVGPSPGPSGHSNFQDIDGGLPNHANYSAGKGPSDGHY